MLRFYILLCLMLMTGPGHAQKLRVSENNRFLVQEDGQPFFWAGDTAWELFHRCTREDAIYYLSERARQGFNVIQAVALAEMDGLNEPNSYGVRPLLENDPGRPNEVYFEHVDYIINAADSLGMYIALLPTWGDKVNKSTWGKGPEIFSPATASEFGKWIGERYREYDNIIWIIGGDRNPREGSSDIETWNAMAEAIAKATGGYDASLMSFHPQPKEPGGSSTWFHREPWLDFNMHQTGHCPDRGTHTHITHDYQLSPVKPVMDGEPLYEDHPNCFNAEDLGYSIPENIRRIMYWNVFAGAFGQTYGCHDVWQMYDVEREPVNGPLRPWKQALDLPMARQLKHLKNLMLSRPFLTRIPDQAMVVDQHQDWKDHVIATRDENGSYAMIYFPTGKETQLDLSNIDGAYLKGYWYDPRTGNSFPASLGKSAISRISPPTSGQGQDWVLVVDTTSSTFTVPGVITD